jgi:sarcosine oxidase
VVHVPDVIVVGGGVMGTAAAWQLASRGRRVLLLEQHWPGHRLGSSHGTSRIFRLAYPHSDYIDLAIESLGLWRQAERDSGRSLLTLTGAVDHGDAAAAADLHRRLLAAGRQADLLDPVDASRLWPGLRFETTVLHHPDAGRLHADASVTAFRELAEQRGAQVIHGAQVTSVHIDSENEVVVIAADGTRFTAQSVVLAAGAWTPSLAGDVLPGLPPLRVTVEQPLHFPTQIPLERWPSFIHHGAENHGAPSGVYGLGSIDGVKVGGHAVGREVDPRSDDRAVDIAAVHRLQSYVREWIPGVDHTRAAPQTCLYAVTPDHDFVVDRVGPLTVLAGFSGHGFKFAPVIGRLAADLALGTGAAPSRFALGSAASDDVPWRAPRTTTRPLQQTRS